MDDYAAEKLRKLKDGEISTLTLVSPDGVFAIVVYRKDDGTYKYCAGLWDGAAPAGCHDIEDVEEAVRAWLSDGFRVLRS